MVHPKKNPAGLATGNAYKEKVVINPAS